MDDPVINYIVVGEYELALLYLLNYIFNNRNYNDLVFITNKVISSKRQTTSADLDNMPFVTKTYKAHLPLKKYFLSSALYPEVQIMASRGCPHSCIFCAWPQIFTGKRLRMRSVENVIGEIRWIKKNMPQIREIVFEDDTFSLNPTWVKHFCENMIGQGIDIAWSAQVRVDMDTSILPLMKKSGCRLLIVGFESGNDSMLALMKKGITVDQSISFAQEIKQNNILLHGDFVIGLPGETLSTIKKTEELINIIRPEILQVSIATPFPGTEFYQMCIDNNALTETDYSNYLDKNGHQKAIINYPDLSTDCIKNSVDHILKTYYLSIRYVPLALRQVFRKNGIYEFIRLLKSAIVFLKTHI
jgi:radical SAM superfamily enzyme YgiQ (UPF0313 family)